MFEKPQDRPPFLLEDGVMSPITIDIARQLRLPVGAIRFWNLPMFWAPMPKAAIDKNSDLGPGEDNVRSNASSLELEQQVFSEAKTPSLQL